MDEAALERYARMIHAAREAVNAKRERPFILEPWERRTAEQQEQDIQAASTVAAAAVRDAGLENTRMRAQLFAFTTHRPAIFNALRAAVAGSGTEAARKHYRAALEALGGKEGES